MPKLTRMGKGCLQPLIFRTTNERSVFLLRYLLMDLDGTLLPVDSNFFLERYLYGLAPISGTWRMRPLIQQLMASTMETINNNDPRLTNEMVFWENFSQRMGVPRQELEPIFNEYYAKEFPGLKRYLPRPTGP